MGTKERFIDKVNTNFFIIFNTHSLTLDNEFNLCINRFLINIRVIRRRGKIRNRNEFFNRNFVA